MKHSHNFSCIITAGGLGKRFDPNEKKQFVLLDGKPILHYAIDIFYPIKCINEIIVTLPQAAADISDTPPKNVTDHDDFQPYFRKGSLHRIKYISGGETRQKSVYNALQVCNPKNNFVIIHDAVRPFFSDQELSKMLNIITHTNALIPAGYVKNTIKEVADSKVKNTLNRETLIEVYTPQIFKLSMLKEFHEKTKDLDHVFTDDAGICEYFNLPVMWFETASPVLKITTKNDLEYADYLAKKYNS